VRKTDIFLEMRTGFLYWINKFIIRKIMSKEEQDMSLGAGTVKTYITPKPFTPQDFKPHPAKESLLIISEAIRFALKNLGYSVAEAPGYDPVIIRQIQAEGEVVSDYLAKVLRARRTADRDELKMLTDTLKVQVSAILAAAERLKAIAANTDKPEWVNVYLQTVVTNLAEVDTLVKRLP